MTAFCPDAAYGPACKGCASAGRRLVIGGRNAAVLMQTVKVGIRIWLLCPVCDRAPTDAPAWRNV